MPIQTSYEPLFYAGDGITNAFPVTWPFQFATDLVVNATVVATGVTTLQVLGTDYAVSPVTNSPAATGTVTTTVAVPVGTELAISRAVPLTQNTTWVANDPNPTLATENGLDKLTMIAQGLQQAITALSTGTTGIVTTATFAIAAIASSQTVTVSSIGTLVVGNNVQVSTGAITVIGQITAVAGVALTVTTLAIPAGSVGATMPIGAAVQLASVPGTNSIQIADAATAAAALVTQTLSGSAASAPGGGAGYQVDLFVASNASGNATVKGYLNTATVMSNIHQFPGVAFDNIAWLPAHVTSWQSMSAGGAGTVLTTNGTSISFATIGASSITALSLTPGLFAATNGPSAGQALTYNAGQFTWANVGGSGVPGGGNAGQFLNGAVAFSNALTSASSLGTPFQLTNTFSTTQSLIVTTGTGTTGTTYVNNTSGGVGDPFAPHIFRNPIVGVVAPSHYPNYASANVEAFASNGYLRGAGMRTDQSGFWSRIGIVNAPSSTLTLDLFTASYYRLTGFANNVTIVLNDTSPTTTSGDVYSTTAYVEIVAPGAFTVTWPGNITWANGASAPTLSTTGTSVVSLLRRQGQTQWIGYLLSSGSTIPGPGTITAASQFAGTGFIPVNLLNTTGSPSSSTFLNGAGAWAVPASGINVQQNGGNVGGSGGTGPFTTINCTTNLTATNTGGVLTLSAAGGGGITPPRGFYNILSYGADATGSADSTAAIALAISTAVSAGGGTVYLPAGTYKVSSTIALANNVSLLGDGCGKRGSGALVPATKLLWAGGASNMVSGTGNLGGLVIQGICLSGNSTATKGLYLEALSNSSVRNCSIENMTSISLHIVPQSGQDAHTNNVYENLYITGSTTTFGIKIEAAVFLNNACHCTFSDIFIACGSASSTYCVEVGWSDNITWSQIFTFPGNGDQVNTATVHLRSQVGALGAGAYAQSQYFFHLEGRITVDAGVGGNTITNYDRSNGQLDPILGSGALLMWTECSSTAMGTFWGNGSNVYGVEYVFSLNEAAILSPALNSGNPVKFSRINFT